MCKVLAINEEGEPLLGLAVERDVSLHDGFHEVDLCPHVHAVDAVVLASHPNAHLVVGAYRVEHVVGQLLLVEGPAPVHAGDGFGVGEVEVVESLAGRAKGGAAPYLEQAVVLSGGSNQLGVGGEDGKLDGVGEPLCPRLLNVAVGVEEGQRGAPGEQLVGHAPRQRRDGVAGVGQRHGALERPLDGALVVAIGAVDVDVARRAYGELARGLVDGDGLELELVVDVERLDDMVGTVEEDEGVARDVGLVGEDGVSRAACDMGRGWAYDDLEALPQAMGHGLQFGLRAPRENAAHQGVEGVATVAAPPFSAHSLIAGGEVYDAFDAVPGLGDTRRSRWFAVPGGGAPGGLPCIV